jgi:CheY-like chemotaxis protein
VRALVIAPREQPRAIVRDRIGTPLAETAAHMRTLVADDDPIITTILSTALARNGMEVIVAHDGDVAWQALNSMQPPSLAILDWMMPTSMASSYAAASGARLVLRPRTSSS